MPTAYSHIGLTYDDALNTVTTVESDGVKTITNVYTYDMFNQLTEQTLITSDSQYTVAYEYDRVGNNISYIDESGNVTKSEYDILGNPTKLISPMGNAEEYTYDLLGNVTRYINGEGDVQEYVYDALGRQIISRKYFEGMCSEYRTYYDVMGNAVKTVDENGNETTYEYNERNLLTSSKAYAETGNGIKTEYAYDAEGSITLTSYGSISDPLKRNTTKNYYDHLGNLTKRVDNSGKISYYEYDGAGQLIKSTDPKSTETVYEYDVLGRQTRISNGINPDTVYSYNLFGELESITEGDKYITYTYDERGYLTESSTGITEDTYIYDVRGNVLEHTTTDKTAGEIRSTYTYDADNRTTSVITPMGIQALSYDKANRLIKSENSRTGSVKQIVYDQRGLPVSAITKLGDTTLSTENNVYDFMGNKVRYEENGYVREYKYDGLNRLTSVSEDNKETLYEIDVYGNIAKEHEIVGLKLNTKLYYYDKDNRLILTEKDSNVTIYEYDANGNLTRELSKYSDIHYEYDGYNRLTNVIKPNEIISYEYNAEGFRDKKYTKDGMTRFIYDSGSVSAEILPNGNVYKYYRADGIIGSIDSTGSKLYYSQNTHSDVTTIYDVTGIVLKDYRYSAYGKPQTIRYNGINQPYLIQWYAETNNVHNPFGYCGEYTDSETGFVYLRNRYYDPSTGRFVQEDPVRDGLNWYIYCENNPIIYIDPWGTRHKGELITIGTGTHHDVWKIQDYLNKQGYVGANGKVLDEDGIFGANTQYAVKNYQRDHGLGVDGIVGDKTWAKMGFKNTILSSYKLPQKKIDEKEGMNASPKKKMFEISGNFGTGLSAKIKFAGVGVDVGGKRYYNVTDMFTDSPTESLEFSAYVSITDELSAGGRITGIIDPTTQEHLRNEGFAGIKIGEHVLGFDDITNDSDFCLDFSLGGYLGVGGEINLKINLSEIWKRIH